MNIPTEGPADDEDCPTCGEFRGAISLPFGREFAIFADAEKAAEQASVRLGCEVTVSQQNDRWQLELYELCAYRVINRHLPDIPIDWVNGPRLHVGTPCNLLACDLTLEEVSLHLRKLPPFPEQKVMVGFGPNWCIYASLNAEESEQVRRLYEHFVDDCEASGKLSQITLFREFVWEATSMMLGIDRPKLPEHAVYVDFALASLPSVNFALRHGAQLDTLRTSSMDRFPHLIATKLSDTGHNQLAREAVRATLMEWFLQEPLPGKAMNELLEEFAREDAAQQGKTLEQLMEDTEADYSCRRIQSDGSLSTEDTQWITDLEALLRGTSEQSGTLEK